MGTMNVAIADDNERTLQLLDTIISSDRDLKLVGKAGDGEQLIDIIREKEPDVVLLDIIMPKLDGLSAMMKIREQKNIPILILSAKS